MNRTLLFAAATLTCLSLEAASFAAPPEYRVMAFPGTDGTAFSLNESGDVVGSLKRGGQTSFHAFVYDSETDEVTHLGTFGGNGGAAADINESGAVVGWAATPSPPGSNTLYQPFIYENKEMKPIELPGDQFLRSAALSINDDGLVVGFASSEGRGEAFRFDGQSTVALGTLGGGSSLAIAINNAGIIVGQSNGHAMRYEDGVMEDLGSLGGQFDGSVANAINENGLIVGAAFDPMSENTRAAVFANGAIELLGAFAAESGSEALGVNDLGAIVGRSGTADLPNGFGHAFIYFDDTMYDLNDYLRSTGDFHITEAWGINNQGQIAGRARLANGEYRAVVLTPVPEPTTLALAAITLLAAAIAIPKKESRAGGRKCRVMSDE